MAVCSNCNDKLYVRVPVGKNVYKSVVCGCVVKKLAKAGLTNAAAGSDRKPAQEFRSMKAPLIFWDDSCVFVVISSEIKLVIQTDEDLSRARTCVYRHIDPDDRPAVMDKLAAAYANYRKLLVEKAIKKFTISDQ